ncbi:alpha/beta hydrolase [Sphingomonas sp. AOB5]|uniref:alpha/beta hydrolase n=1 Tax=Sphingomonas sp. AOB5 TaxID=3034017 RepID=UPI0023FA130E|nr:alpha/beta hydrolase [Sphingomonas sp. AOB5]MDF7774894.1 alpha/beta hydrolase [Sphingomonas sp. AOB5]
MTPVDRRTLIGAALAAPLLPAVAHAASAPAFPEPAFSVKLWPGEAPGLKDPALKDEVIERSKDPAIRDRAMVKVRTPRMDVFPAKNPNGAAVLITPGGGYQRVVIDKEGYELAAWLAERGVTAFVCFYRLPGQGWENPRTVSLADAQRAMRLIRHRAAEWKIDPKRVAALGYSAGGHVCGDLATRHAEKVYAPVDDADTLDAKPIVAAPIYPAIAMDPFLTREAAAGTYASSGTGWQVLDAQVSKDTPPCFLCHAEDDATLPVEFTVRLRAALKAAGVPVETHLFEEGGHGFGLRFTLGKPVAAWPDLFMAFAKRHGW